METKTISNSTNSRQNTTVTEFFQEQFPDCKPYVRYCRTSEDGGQRQEAKLRSIHSHIPEWAVFASPVYFLTPSQEDRLGNLWRTPRGTKGTANIAIELQDECEDTGHVLYPVYAESDAVEDGVPFVEIVEWLQAFAREVLDVAPDDCLLYFSGGRSVHLHAPLFVSHARLYDLKNAAEAFCKETGAELDACIYSRKRQFRLPGVLHNNGVPKVPLDPDDPNGSVARRINRGEVTRHETFADVLAEVFNSYLRRGHTPFLLLTAPMTPDTKTVLGSPRPRNPKEQNEWDAHNRHEFSPYANARRGGQSVVVFQVLGEPFEKTATFGRATHVPAFIHAGHGCTGTDFTKHREYAPVQLSNRDAEKWDFEKGETVVLIGGQSRSSRIFTITGSEAGVLADDHLHYERGDRQRALTYLKEQGYDVGKGRVRSNRKSQSKPNTPETTDTRLSNDSRAAKLERQAEQDGIHSLSHTERRRVAFRRLKRDWDYAWEWFEEQFGEEFKPEVTRQQFLGCIRAYPEDYAHVKVPETR